MLHDTKQQQSITQARYVCSSSLPSLEAECRVGRHEEVDDREGEVQDTAAPNRAQKAAGRWLHRLFKPLSECWATCSVDISRKGNAQDRLWYDDEFGS